MQSLFVLLRITIFRKTFISPLANENFVFSKQIPHVTIKMKIHRISRRTTDDKISHMPQNKINTPAGQTGRFPYPARLNRKFRHPASPAKGFRIFSQAGKFPYFDLFPDRGSSFRTAQPVPLFHLTRQEVPTSRLTRQRFPHSSPTKQVPVFRSGPKFPDCKKTPPSFKNGGVSLIQTSDYSAAEVSSSTLYSAMCSNRLRFSLTFS